jgi:hypothetical protein
MALELQVRGCFYRLMRFLWDERRIDALEKKVDDGFAEMRREFTAVRSESREDSRTLLGIVLAMFMTMIFGFAAILLQHL